ncbi:MAG: hypothetical protein RSD74_02090 [Angelakisella sp.]
MKSKDLSRLFYLNREIEEDSQRLSELEAYAMGTSSGITGLPHIGGISNKTAIAAEIADAKSIIEKKREISIAEYNRINRYIASIDDALVRQIVTLRFVNGLSWVQVALHIGGDNTPDSVRMALRRYIHRH